jgi:5-methyltetrahydropteroyltriglutamate--homocysteine methyltransferase
MQRSTNRILTTHIGSLPRPDDLIELLQGGADKAVFDKRVRAAVNEVVAKQVELGIDVVNDGEQGKPSFITYILSASACPDWRHAARAAFRGPDRARSNRSRNSMATWRAAR